MKIVSNYDLSGFDFLAGVDVRSVDQFITSVEVESDFIVFILNNEQWTCIADTDNFYCAQEKVCIYVQEISEVSEGLIKKIAFDQILPFPISKNSLNLCIDNAKKHHLQLDKLASVEEQLEIESEKLNDLNEIGQALSSISDPYVLMNLILTKSRELTNADAGSICVVRYDSDDNPIELNFAYFQNDTLNQNVKVDLTLPVSKKSLAGYVGFTGEALIIDDVYEISPDKDYVFHNNVDLDTGYRTKSMMVYPMVDNEAKILGVVQLINKKSPKYQALADTKINVDQIISFTQSDQSIMQSLTSQAAMCLKNTTLLADIQTLFEGFVNASVTAIEQRDPTTSGHSFRVALMTCHLANAASQMTDGLYKDVHYNTKDIQEIRYASLLHDFGKIGVREQVLVKAKKLYPYEMDNIRSRFEYILKSLETQTLAKKLNMIESMGYGLASAHFSIIDQELKANIDSIEDIIYFIIKTNEPSILEEGNFQRLLQIADRKYLDPYGQQKSYLVEREVEALSIRKGSITMEERKEIESHVTHSFTFLSKIPWTRGLKHVPAIAYGHHEWLSGDGYPNNLTEDEILLQSKMMAIADIYDALTAADRPYKKAMPVEKALFILEMEVKGRHLDGNLVKLFVEKESFKAAENY
ncbi:MAG: GAF domain-containing protein [Candidatus Cloacimonetes bacterium]|nr:GAF domain-containing protein [Candidatus Cloacimonadota bacterium]